MILDPIAKTFAVRAPDAPGPDRTGHGVIVLTAAKTPQDAIIQAPLCLDARVRDAFEWRHAIAYECKVTGIRQLQSGTVRIALDL